ncbi:MAG TPA: ankyrin repeat domain-containing protein [Chryseosolibacter sp.]|nr:ankyrin repeat domain-containing protein [Chryseosolibacter sp.]
MDNHILLDDLFRKAVSAIDAGDLAMLRALLTAHPELARERLQEPGAWLTAQLGGAIPAFFNSPYLLWFVAEDPVRQGKLPTNIPDVASTIIDTARSHSKTVNEQIEYAARLVAWSVVARKSGVQIPLMAQLLSNIDYLPHRLADDALVNGNFELADYIVQKGGQLTYPVALCLMRRADAARLKESASAEEKQFGLVLSALRGLPEALKLAIEHGGDPTKPAANLFSHGTPLHHAVWSGSIECVQIVVEAGADLSVCDLLYNATPLGWAEYGGHKTIAAYLRQQGACQ